MSSTLEQVELVHAAAAVRDAEEAEMPRVVGIGDTTMSSALVPGLAASAPIIFGAVKSETSMIFTPRPVQGISHVPT